MNHKLNIFIVVFLLFISLTITNNAYAWQEARPSQGAMVSQTIKTTTITVVYHRPVVKGRTIYGDLVPYDEHWRGGANEVTTFEITKDVTINGKELAAGKYGFWTIPRKNGTWTLVFTSAPDVWGKPYKPGAEVLEVDTKVEEADHEEYLSYSFPEITPDSGVLALRWEKIMMPINIKVK